MSQRISSLSDELRMVIRLAARDPEALEGALPMLSSMQRVVAADDLDEAARVHLILHRLIPEYLQRLPGGRDCMAIRELLTWEDGDGEVRSLTTRYHKASAHLVNAGHDFGRRQEPRLLLECARRFVALDHEDRLEAASRPAVAAPVEEDDPRDDGAEPASATASPRADPPAAPAAGITRVHKTIDYQVLTDYMADADEIVILNTWIPELSILADAIVDALARGTYVSILMLYPESSIARLRTEALQGSMQPPFREDQVQPGVRHCLEVLAAIASMAGERRRRHLKVRLYDSLPSIAVYAVDDRAFVSLFLHGQLAFRSVQIEIEGQDSLMGAVVFRELETLWKIGQQFEDVTQWQTELLDMAHRFEISR